MKKISKQTYQTLIEGGSLLKSDAFGDKVWQLADGRILKLFRVKRRLSSARLFSYASRFVRNSIKLKRLGIRTVTVEEQYVCKELERQIVIYRYLAGKTLDSLFASQTDSSALVEKFAKFLAQLHAKGIYFRSVHTGNVVLCENGELGIIDITDIRFSIFALSPRQRARNFYHLLRYPFESGIVHDFGIDRFLAIYQEAANLSPLKRRLFLRHLPQVILKGPLAEKL